MMLGIAAYDRDQASLVVPRASFRSLLLVLLGAVGMVACGGSKPVCVARFPNIRAPLLLNAAPLHLGLPAADRQWTPTGALEGRVEQIDTYSTRSTGGAVMPDGTYLSFATTEHTATRWNKVEMEASRALGGRTDRVVVGLRYRLSDTESRFLSDSESKVGITVLGQAMEPAREQRR